MRIKCELLFEHKFKQKAILVKEDMLLKEGTYRRIKLVLK